MKTVICALALSLVTAVMAVAEEIRPGLMWNRTGLPAVFPLIVQTAPGQDYYLLLKDADSGAPALAAYAKGGRFFRVLVPPGRFTVRIAYGTGWEGEDTLFGPGDETRIYDLDAALVFAVTGLGTKSGHRIDLTGLAEGVEVRVIPLLDHAELPLEPAPPLAKAFEREGIRRERLFITERDRGDYGLPQVLQPAGDTVTERLQQGQLPCGPRDGYSPAANPCDNR